MRAYLVSIIMISTILCRGCLGLVAQREIMESWREDPNVIYKEVTVGWSETFETNVDFENITGSVIYQNETELSLDDTVSTLEVQFRAQLPYSSLIEETFGNDTNEVRYIEARLWEPGAKAAGGNPFWEVRATQDYPLERIEWRSSELINGVWILEVEARGYGLTAPIEQFSFYDHFDLYATITKPCVRFAASHEIGECAFLSDLN